MPKTGKNKFTELGSSGLNRYGGMVGEEFVKDLSRSRSRYKIFKEMALNDPVVAAILFAVKQVLRSNEWLVEPSDEEDEKAVEYADFVRECKDDMSQTWSDFISECLTFLEHGWSYFEIVYKKRLGSKPSKKYTDDPAQSKYGDGKVGWRKFAPRGQDTLDHWEFDESGGTQGMWQRAAPEYNPILLPIEKCMLFRTRVEKNSPEGRAVLRSAYRPWFMKKNLEVIMAIGIERNLNGMPTIYLPENFTKEDYDKAREITERVRMDEFYGLVLPGPKAGMEAEGQQAGWLFELVTGASRQTLDVLSTLEYYDRRIAMAVLAQFLMLGTTVGSWALSRDQSDLFLIALEGWSQMIADVINRHAIPKLMRMNGWDEDLSPTIVPTPLSRVNLAEMAEWIKTMFAVQLPLEDLEDQLRAMADLPVRTEEEKKKYEEEKEQREQEMRQQMQQQPGEEEEIEKAEDDWHVVGRVPTAADILSGWTVTDEDKAQVAAEFEAVLG